MIAILAGKKQADPLHRRLRRQRRKQPDRRRDEAHPSHDMCIARDGMPVYGVAALAVSLDESLRNFYPGN